MSSILGPLIHHRRAFRAQRIQNLAYALIKAGIKPGDRVGVISPNAYVVLETTQKCCQKAHTQPL